MPRVPQEWLDCVVYLYETKEQALEGKQVGATGFIVSMSAEDPELPEVYGHHYIATNRHCLEPHRDLVARINLRGNAGVDVIELPYGVWEPHPSNDDVTVAPFELKVPAYQYASVNRGMILSRDLMRLWDFGPGDEAFFIGRYVDLDGKTYNVPSVRSGIVSAYPVEPIIQPRRGGHPQESFLVEARSLTGYSGSPVFVTQSARIEKANEGIDGVPTIKAGDGSPVFLLGIDWGHHQWFEYLRDRDGRRLEQKFPTNSGMMKVVPAWRLLDILDLSHTLVTVRRDREDMTRKALSESSVAHAFVAQQPVEEYQPFEDLTRKLVQTTKPRGD